MSLLTASVKLEKMDASALMAKARAAAGDAVDAIASRVEQTAKSLVPVDTGRLQEAIHTETVRDDATARVVQVTPAFEASNPWGFDPAYARRIELGFIGTDSLGRVYHQQAQPYMRPAWDEQSGSAPGEIAEAVAEALK